MLRGISKLLAAIAVAVPLVTFGTAGGPVGAIPPSKPICFGVRGAQGDAAIVNLTPVLASAAGDGQLVALNLAFKPPKAANVNFAPGTVDPNVAFSQIGARGSVCFVNSKHANVDLIADHLGTVRGSFYQFAQKNGAPYRVLNTRNDQIIGPSQTRCFGVAGRPNDVAVVNLTPIGANAAGNGQLVSSNVKNNPPKAANVNFGPGTVDPNVALARIGNDGKVCFVNSKHASVHVIADHLGTIKGGAFSSSQPNGAPKRVLDTNKGGNIIPPGGNRCFAVAGAPGDAAVVNLTPIKASAGGNGQLVSSNVKNNPPKAANVNFAPGTVDPNVAIARIGNDGKVCFINSKQASVHVIADHLGTIKAGAYISAQPNGAPRRAVDTRTGAEITPVSTSGPDPIRPSMIDFECGYVPGIGTRMITFGGLDTSVSPNKYRITLIREPANGGKDYVIEDQTRTDGVQYLVTYSAPDRIQPIKTDWIQQVKVDVYIGTGKASTSVFDVADKCVPERLKFPTSNQPSAFGGSGFEQVERSIG